MSLKVIIVMCILQTYFSCGICDEYRNGYTRIKRAKYYSNPPVRIYKLPPMIPPIRGPFSYTPPPGYMEDGDENPARRPLKVSKQREGLGDEDFRNLIKHLSKQDFDRIVELAAQKDKHAEHFRPDVSNGFKTPGQAFDSSKVFPFSNDEKAHIEYNSPTNFVQIKSIKNIERIPQLNQVSNQINPYLDVEQMQQNEQFSYLNDFIHEELNSNSGNQEPRREPYKENDIFTNSERMKEEQLPRPENLREDNDYDISYTNNVPTIVKAESSSYKLENFANLPLMNYENSKLESVNSYSVPHYTVARPRTNISTDTNTPAILAEIKSTIQRKAIQITSSRTQTSPQSFASPQSSSSFTSSFSSPNVPPIQPAPPKSAAAQQSDAHLKATKIWTHKSTGTAYTLHDDGTLSLERPSRPKRKF